MIDSAGIDKFSSTQSLIYGECSQMSAKTGDAPGRSIMKEAVFEPPSGAEIVVSEATLESLFASIAAITPPREKPIKCKFSIFLTWSSHWLIDSSSD